MLATADDQHHGIDGERLTEERLVPARLCARVLRALIRRSELARAMEALAASRSELSRRMAEFEQAQTTLREEKEFLSMRSRGVPAASSAAAAQHAFVLCAAMKESMAHLSAQLKAVEQRCGEARGAHEGGRRSFVTRARGRSLRRSWTVASRPRSAAPPRFAPGCSQHTHSVAAQEASDKLRAELAACKAQLAGQQAAVNRMADAHLAPICKAVDAPCRLRVLSRRCVAC